MSCCRFILLHRRAFSLGGCRESAAASSKPALPCGGHLGAPRPASTARSSPREGAGTVPRPSSLTILVLMASADPQSHSSGCSSASLEEECRHQQQPLFPCVVPGWSDDSGTWGLLCRTLTADFWLCLPSACSSVIGAAGLYQVLWDALLNASWL